MSGLAVSQRAGGQAPPATVKVWDPFVRLFHWTLAGLVLVAFLTGDEAEKVHIAVGYAILGLISARIVWGFVGPRHARFTDFVKSPAEILRYARQELRGRAPRRLGHNPLGGAMVVGLLTTLSAVSILGYLLTTDAYWGVEQVKEIHEAAAYLLLGMAGLHVLGVVWTSASHRENLVKAMITGRKPV
jgi:cytochrome b